MFCGLLASAACYAARLSPQSDLAVVYPGRVERLLLLCPVCAALQLLLCLVCAALQLLLCKCCSVLSALLCSCFPYCLRFSAATAAAAAASCSAAVRLAAYKAVKWLGRTALRLDSLAASAARHLDAGDRCCWPAVLLELSVLAALAEPEPEPLAPAARPRALSGQQDSSATAVVRTIRLTDTKQQQAIKSLPDSFKGICEVAC